MAFEAAEWCRKPHQVGVVIRGVGLGEEGGGYSKELVLVKVVLERIMLGYSYTSQLRLFTKNTEDEFCLLRYNVV
jgi:hypothetical protein